VAQAGVDNAMAAVETAQANAQSAKANIEEAEVTRIDMLRVLERNKELVRRSVLSQNDLDSAQTAYDAAVSQLKAVKAQLNAVSGQLKAAMAQERLAKAQYTSALAQVEQARANRQAADLDLQHTRIRAPVNGIVISRDVDVGQTVAASLQAPTLFLIAQDLTQMQVDTHVSEADIGRVWVGQAARFTVDAYPDLTFTGQVIQVRNAPMTIENVVTYNAVVRVANPELALKPGMTANVAFLIAERQDVLKVPNTALRFRPDGGVPAMRRRDGQAPQRPGSVWVFDANGRPEARPLTLGLVDETHTEVISGDLLSGQQVITGRLVPTKARTPSGPPGFRP
jgi:HlyD family secretion protein